MTPRVLSTGEAVASVPSVRHLAQSGTNQGVGSHSDPTSTADR
jgi:hypothetical protein